MSVDSSHRGAVPTGPGFVGADRRTNDLVESAALRDPLSTAAYAALADPYRSTATQAARDAQASPLRVGLVVHALPQVHWYKVQFAGGQGTALPACLLSGDASLSPLGVRPSAPLAPNSRVLACVLPGIPVALILGVIPPRLIDAQTNLPDWIVQGGNSGLRREQGDLQLFKNLFQQGGVIDFSCGRPFDATPFEWGRFSETGLGLHLDSYAAFLRVNEACGLFLSYWDGHARLAGQQLLIESGVHTEEALCDEGEPRLYRGEALYVHEALGLYAAGTAIAQPFPPAAVQYTDPRGALDLPEGSEDLEPFERYREYGGYLGQGRQRFVALPPSGASGGRYRKDAASAPDIGVFHELVAPDGSYSLRSAKSIFLGKRTLISVPRTLKLPPDGTGDDAQADNYKFAGLFGSGADHKVGDLDAGSDAASLLRPAASADFTAHAHNWKGHLPFHYHEKDYALPEESADPTFSRAVEALDYGGLANNDLLPDPAPTTAQVDDRYGDVNYYLRECGVRLLEDGGVEISGGGGCRLVLAAGKIRIEAPGDIELVCGRNLISLAYDAIVRAKNSVDLSAGNGDLRLKAENNMQLLAGNSGTGGVLIESRAKETVQSYQNAFGEDVVSSGVILRAPSSQVAALAQEVYLRTGGDGPLGSGDIILDAGQGQNNVTLYSAAVNLYNNEGVYLWNAPTGTSSSVSMAHYLGPEGVLLGGGLVVSGSIESVSGPNSEGGLLVDGSVGVTGSIGAAGSVASSQGGYLGKVGDSFATQLAQAAASAAASVAALIKAGDTAYRTELVAVLYTPDDALGNTQLLEQLTFSFRDPPGDGAGAQYHTRALQFAEPGWCRDVRLGAASGGESWDEPAVSCQGVDTYPWPGASAWNDNESCLQLESLTLYDPEAGRDRDRGSTYEDVKLGGWTKTPLSQALKTVF